MVRGYGLGSARGTLQQPSPSRKCEEAFAAKGRGTTKAASFNEISRKRL
jgi:hypothetical protein